MNNERNKILKMLENREITVEEASRLLAALENRSSGIEFNNSTLNSNNNNNNNINKSTNKDFSNIINKVSNIASTVVKKGAVVANNIESEVKKFISEHKSTKSNSIFNKEFNYNLFSFENNIQLSSLNGEMHLKGYNGDKLTLRAIYEPLNSNANIEFYNLGDNNYILNFKQEDFKKVSIEVLMPIKYFKQINVNNINSNFSIDTLKFETLISKSNSSNGIIENCDCNSINIDSNTDGKFIVRNILAESLNINTINGFVKLKNLDVKNVKVDNINGEIEAINDYFNKYDDYNWVLETQNNPINVEINTNNVNYKIKAQTTLGSIDINKNNLSFLEKTAFSILAETESKNINNKNMDISLMNTNSKILLS